MSFTKGFEGMYNRGNGSRGPNAVRGSGGSCNGNNNPFSSVKGLSDANRRVLNDLSKSSNLSQAQMRRLAKLTGGRINSKQSRQAKSKCKVKAPKVGTKSNKTTSMEHVREWRPSRRPYNAIQNYEEKQNSVFGNSARLKKPVSTAVEKRRLQLQCQFGGGNILPGGGTLCKMDRPVPLELVTNRPSQRLSRGSEAAKKAAKQREERKKLEESFDEVALEVEQRKRDLNHARGARARGRIQTEISNLVSEMKNIDDLLRSTR